MANCNYKVNLTDIQNKYKFKIFNTGTYNDSDLRKMIESVFYALPRTTGTGTSVTLDDTAFSYLKNKLYATELTQETTTGKNLFDGNSPSGLQPSWATTTSFSNETITVSSVAQSTSPYATWEFNVSEGDVFRINAIIKDSNGLLAKQVYNGSSWVNYATRNYIDGTSVSSIETTIASGEQKIRYLLYSNKSTPSANSTSNYKNVIITKNNSDMTYERYTGGIPSPNPSYPQTVQTITGNNSIKISNKNMLNIPNGTGTISSIDYSISNQLITLNGTGATSQYPWIVITANGVHTKNNTPTASDIIGWANGTIIYEGNSYFSMEEISGTTTATISRRVWDENGNTLEIPTGNNKISAVGIYLGGAKTYNQYVWGIQLEIGSTATSYIAHQGQVKTLTLGDKEICKIGNYEDKIFKAIAGNEIYDSLTTVEQNTLDYGKWYINKAIGKIDSYNGETITTNYISTTGGLDTGSTVYYQLATPTYEKFNDTIQDQLEDIYNNMLSYEGQTNISQTNAGLPFNINSTAIKDLNNL